MNDPSGFIATVPCDGWASTGRGERAPVQGDVVGLHAGRGDGERMVGIDLILVVLGKQGGLRPDDRDVGRELRGVAARVGRRRAR